MSMLMNPMKPYPCTLFNVEFTWIVQVDAAYMETATHKSWVLLGISELWRRQWHPTPVLLPENSHGQRSLVGCSPWGHEESDTTERLHFHFSLSCIGEGNGNPLQCSCLENPRDRGAWWAAVYGFAQSRTWLNDLAAAAAVSMILKTYFLFK